LHSQNNWEKLLEEKRFWKCKIWMSELLWYVKSLTCK
jgi:hypothetical protein